MSALKLIVLVVVCLALCEAKKIDSLKQHHLDKLQSHVGPNGNVDKLIEKAEPEFEKHKTEHGHTWDADEDDHRFTNFAKVHHSIEEHNNESEKHGYKLASNHFAHLDEHEIRSMHGTKHVEDWPATPVHSKRATPPTSIDWRAKGAVTHVKNQGSCGSCWTFSATGALEAALHRHTGKLTSLSEEHLVSCATKEYLGGGCDGGVPILAFDYAKDSKGLQTEAAYPYIEVKTPEGSPVSACRLPAVSHVARAGTSTGNSVQIERNNEAALMQAVGTVGPVSVAIFVPDGPSFAQYSSGIYNNAACKGNPQANHGVLVVGYGSQGGKQYWIVKNSWKPTWGEQGYIRIARNAGNMCSIAGTAAYPVHATINTAKLSAAVPRAPPSGGGGGRGIVNPQG